MASDDRPARRDAQRRAEHDVAEEVAVVTEARCGDVGGDDEGGPRTAVTQVPFEHRRGCEGGRRMAGGERVAFARRTIALRRYPGERRLDWADASTRSGHDYTDDFLGKCSGPI